LLLAVALALLQAQEPVRILVPAYFRPAGDGLRHWDRLIASAEKASITVIVNPASGPGKRVDARYTEVLGRAKGLTLIGYVSTSYGKRTLEEVKADIDRWIEFYPQVRGIFLDEQASGPERLDHYAALYAYVRKEKKLDLVVSNPGINCDEGYVSRPAADVVCLFEHHEGFDAHRPAGWTSKYGPERFLSLPYATPTVEEMRRRVAASIERRFGWTYVTDAAGGNPWNRLPSYWDELLDAVKPKKDR
jgi:hypothetical protein